MAERKTAKLIRRVAVENAFEPVALVWWTQWSPARSVRHAEYMLRRLEADLFPVSGAVPVDELTAPTSLAAVRRIEGRGALDIAKRLMSGRPSGVMHSGISTRTT